MSTIEKLREVILKMKKKNITAANLTPEARFLQDLSFDSQDQTEMLVLAEEAFGISVDFQEVKNMATIAAAVEYIDKKTGKPCGLPVFYRVRSLFRFCRGAVPGKFP